MDKNIYSPIFKIMSVVAILFFIFIKDAECQYTKVYEGVSVSPSTIFCDDDLTFTFSVRETTGTAQVIDTLTLAILKENGEYLFDCKKNVNIDIPGFGTYKYTGTAYTSSGFLSTPGRYQAVARLRPSGYTWLPWETTGEGINPLIFEVREPILSKPVIEEPVQYSIYRIDISAILFEWAVIKYAKDYTLNLYKSDQLNTPYLSIPTSGNTSKNIQMQQLEVGEFTYNVAAVRGSQNVVSSNRVLLIDEPSSKPVILRPSSSASFNNNSNQIFKWESPPNSNIARYYLRIVKGDDFNSTPVFETELSASNQSVNFSEYTTGDYIWGVRAIKKCPTSFDQVSYEQTIGWGNYAMGSFSIIPNKTFTKTVTSVEVVNEQDKTVPWDSVITDMIQIKAIATDCDPASLETIECKVKSEYTGKSIDVVLSETGIATSLFLGEVSVDQIITDDSEDEFLIVAYSSST